MVQGVQSKYVPLTLLATLQLSSAIDRKINSAYTVYYIKLNSIFLFVTTSTANWQWHVCSPDGASCRWSLSYSSFRKDRQTGINFDKQMSSENVTIQPTSQKDHHFVQKGPKSEKDRNKKTKNVTKRPHWSKRYIVS